MNTKEVIIIGGGPAGIEAAYNLANNSCKVKIFEKSSQIGGHIKNTGKLFPNFQESNEIREQFSKKIKHENIELYANSEIEELYKKDNLWHAKNTDGVIYTGNAALLATGFRTFDAKYKEELGYGIYNDVITTIELEEMIISGKILTSEGKIPQRIALLNCVGSRDEKVGNHYCSRVCCINAVKQTIEIKELLPDAEVFCFYMDIRMSGQFYEELYRRSQEEFNVNYIRGRISEAAQTKDNRIQIKAEDTLSRLPLKMTVDILVLMIGIESSDSTTELAKQNEINGEYGFAKSISLHYADNLTNKSGLFLSGACKRPLTLPEAMADGRAAALQINDYLK